MDISQPQLPAPKAFDPVRTVAKLIAQIFSANFGLVEANYGNSIADCTQSGLQSRRKLCCYSCKLGFFGQQLISILSITICIRQSKSSTTNFCGKTPRFLTQKQIIKF